MGSLVIMSIVEEKKSGGTNNHCILEAEMMKITSSPLVSRRLLYRPFVGRTHQFDP